MKNFKKLAALALLVALVGCGGNGDSSSKPAPSSPAPSVSTPAPSVSTPDAGAEDLAYLKTVAKTLVYSGWSTDGVRGDVTLITSLDDGNVAVTYTSSNTDYVVVEDGKLKVTLPEIGSTTSGYTVVTITATLTYNGQTTTKEFLLKVNEVLPEATIADIHQATEAGTYEIKGTVTATNAKGFTVYDGTGHILAYLNKAPEVSVGDYVKVSGTTDFYQGVAQYTSSASIVVLDETAPAEKVFDFTQEPTFYGPEELAAWDKEGATVGAYVTIKGTLVVDGNYYNVNIKNSSIVGSLSYPAADLGAAAFNGKVIEATGFLLYKSGGKYANLMTTEVREATLTEAEMADTVKNTLTLPTSVKNSLTLPVEGAYESTISWVSNNTAAITINEDGTVTVTRGEADTNVTLTATITVGETTVTKDIVVKVLAIDPYEPVLITAPVAGTAYKFMSVQGKLNNKELYFNGQASGTYLATSTKSAEGANVVLVATEGGYYLSIEGETAKYINVRNVYNEEKQKTYTNTYIEDTASTVWTYNTEYNTVVTTIEDTEYYLGTYNEYETFSASNLSYAATSYPARFYTVLDRPTDEEPSDKAPIAGKEYKLMLTQGNLNKDLYFAGAMSGYYYATTENFAEATIIVLEEADGGFYMTFDNNGTKNYLNLVLSADGAHKNVVFGAEAITVWTYNEELDTMTTMFEGAEHYLGTYNSYNTISASSIDKAPTSFVSHLVDPTTTPEAPEVPEVPEPELPEATLAATITFDSTDKRTSFSGEQQVWNENGITITNNKAGSTQPVADYAKPARFYKSTSLTVEYSEEIVMIVIECAYADRALLATDNIAGATVTVDDSGLVCTIILDEPATSFSISSLPRQLRINKLEVYTA